MHRTRLVQDDGKLRLDLLGLQDGNDGLEDCNKQERQADSAQNDKDTTLGVGRRWNGPAIGPPCQEESEGEGCQKHPRAAAKQGERYITHDLIVRGELVKDSICITFLTTG